MGKASSVIAGIPDHNFVDLDEGGPVGVEAVSVSDAPAGEDGGKVGSGHTLIASAQRIDFPTDLGVIEPQAGHSEDVGKPFGTSATAVGQEAARDNDLLLAAAATAKSSDATVATFPEGAHRPMMSMDSLPDTGSGHVSGFGPDFTPLDDLFANQWHLVNTGQFGGTAGMDIDVSTAWDDYDGTGVHVGIYDSGVQYTHHDLDGNYDAAASVIIDGLPHDPFPDLTNSDNAHGTNVAGLIGAENDGTGTVGVAFGSSLTGISIFDFTDPQFIQAFQQMNTFDVTNHSWGFTAGFTDNVLNTADPFWGPFFATFETAVVTGRGGLGTVIVHSAGNDRTNEFNSGAARDTNDSNFTNSRYLVSVAAIDINGFVTHYSTPGAAVFVSAPSAGADGQVGLWTTDYLGADGFNSGSDGTTLDNPFPDYDSVMNGTSGASPIVAGVVALMLDANPNLGWRDVQEILAYSARHVGTAVGTAHAGTWELYDWGFNGAHNWNGGGLHFSNDYGYGLVDATAAVRLAETWTAQSTSANETVWSTNFAVNLPVPDNNPTGVSFNFASTTNFDIERVELEIDWSAAHTYVGDLVITLTSPDGLVSTLLNREGTAFNATAGSSTDLSDWLFTTNAFRGEDSLGTWTINVSDRAGADIGTIDEFKIHFWGHNDSPDDTYIYTNEYATYAGLFSHSTILSDTDGGIDAINAAAVTSGSTINLNEGAVSTIAGQAVTIALGTVIENAYGGDGADIMTGNSQTNLLNGGRGADFLDGGAGADILRGMAGGDFYLIDDAGDIIDESVTGSGGTDEVDSTTVSINLSDVAHVLGFVENAVLQGAANLNATGNGLSNILVGNSGNNQLNGLGGADNMIGGAGNDSYIIDNAGDIADESIAGSGGTDAIYSSTISINLADAVHFLGSIENAVLLGAANLNLTGNGLTNVLTGNTGNNQLNGGAGADILRGMGGNDNYVVDNASDIADESIAGSGGTDAIYSSSISINLADTGHYRGSIENAVLNGAANLNLTGNVLTNTLVGNAGNNTLNGGAGDDVMRGGGGNDNYVVDNASDITDESIPGSGGTDAIYSSSISINLADTVHYRGATENAVLQGAANLNLTGNTLANTLVGNAGNNTLNGGAGADYMRGGAGNDNYIVDNAGDIVDESIAGSGGGDAIYSSTISINLGDTVHYRGSIEHAVLQGATNLNLTGNGLNNILIGNSGLNLFDGGLGADTMTGGLGNDVFRFDTALGGGNIDNITDYAVADDQIQIDNAVFTGLANGALAVAAFFTGAAAHDADDRVIYNSATGALFFDGDGTGATAQIQFATLSAGLAMVASEFTVV